MSQLITRARDFATQAHVDQLRKYTGEPYVIHPIAVADIVASVPHSDEMVAAALLHDVVEDTPTTIEQIEAEFGSKVAELVGWLTDVSRPGDGNRDTRKARDRQHSAMAPPEAQTIKLADIIDNSKSIAEHDPNFWRVYRHEMERLLAVMTEGDAELRARVISAISG